MVEIQHRVLDDAGNATEQHSFEMNHTDTNGIDIDATDSYVRQSDYSWYDAADRLRTVANYGASDRRPVPPRYSSPSTGTMPIPVGETSSLTPLTAYNGSSTAKQETDYFYLDDYNASLVTHTIYPNATSRTAQTTFTTSADQVRVEYNLANPFTFTGRRFDDETGLYYYRMRYYGAELGRFVTRDPIGYEGSEWSLYEYAGARPILSTDPSGLQAGPVMPGDPRFCPRKPKPTPPVARQSPLCNYFYYFWPGNSAPADPPWLNAGSEVGNVLAIGGAAGATGCWAFGCNPVLWGGGAAAAGGALGVGSQAVVAPGLGAGTYPALLINGTVYVARFHNQAWELACRNPRVQKYGMAIIDETGNVIGWMGQ